jgi:hypothetical protein
MDLLFLSYCLNTWAALEARDRHVIDGNAVRQLVDIADTVKWPRLSQAARYVVRDCGCEHMLGERRGTG